MSAWCGLVISAAVLTTITSLQAIQSEGKSLGPTEESAMSSSLSLEVYPGSYPETAKNQKQEENKVMFKSKPKTQSEKKVQETKSYTMTANDFLEMTADKLKENNISDTLFTNNTQSFPTVIEPKTEGRNDRESNIIGPNLYTTIHTVGNNNNSLILTSPPSIEHTLSQNFTKNTEKKLRNKNHELPLESNITNTTSSITDNLRSVYNATEKAALNTTENHFTEEQGEQIKEHKTYFELSYKITDGIKKYSNDLSMRWDREKKAVEETSEAKSVLKDYMDKILISQAANNTVCVKKDLENHEARTKTLQDIFKTCAESLGRKEWHELQDKTKEVLHELRNIEQNVTDTINELSEDKRYEENKTKIENNALKKLQELASPIVKESFEKLKNESLHNDEHEYSKCINDKTQKGIIMDTMTDIMRIKNNCVG